MWVVIPLCTFCINKDIACNTVAISCILSFRGHLCPLESHPLGIVLTSPPSTHTYAVKRLYVIALRAFCVSKASVAISILLNSSFVQIKEAWLCRDGELAYFIVSEQGKFGSLNTPSPKQ